jgi:hypothetical protein
MMGLLDASAVPPMHVYSDTSTSPLLKCFTEEPISTAEVVTTVTIADIQNMHGSRRPEPAQAPHNFHIAFVAESHERLLNATEMTFYDILAAHYTKSLPPQDPDPYVGFNWVPVTRFFGQGTTWRSDIPRVVRRGDVDHDGDVDNDDIDMLRRDRNKPVSQSACGTPCDLNGDGKITSLDIRKVVLLCTRPRCATQ